MKLPALSLIVAFSLGTSLAPAQHYLAVKDGDKALVVVAAHGTQPMVLQGDKLREVRSSSFGLGEGGQYLPCHVAVRHVVVRTSSMQVIGDTSEMNKEFHFSGELETGYSLANVFLVIALNPNFGEKSLFLYEVGKLEPRELRWIDVACPMQMKSSPGQYELYLFSGGRELFQTMMPFGVMEAALDRMVREHLKGVREGSVQPFIGPAPEYFRTFLKKGVEGSATVLFTIGPNGAVLDPSVSEASQPEFGEALMLNSGKSAIDIAPLAAMKMQMQWSSLAQTTDNRIISPIRAVRIGANVFVILLWLWLYRSVFDYLAVIFSREDFRTNQIVLVAVLALIAIQIRKEHIRPQFDAAPQLFVPALLLALGGSLLYLIVERFLDINTISASLFGLASYGLLGLWMQPQRWRQGFPAALLVVGVLPFGEHMQTFIGYPMRLLTASIVRDGLAAAGVSSIGIDTILVLENGVSQVDLPCSGVKSLWTGALFLIAATWVERRPLNWRWLLIAFVLAVFLFVTNLARVGVLVVVGQVAGWRLVAEMIHVPLGVLGFIASCAAAVVLLRLERPIAQEDRRATSACSPGVVIASPDDRDFRDGTRLRAATTNRVIAAAADIHISSRPDDTTDAARTGRSQVVHRRWRGIGGAAAL